MGISFDYETSDSIEGRGCLNARSRDLASLRLERCLTEIKLHSGKLLEVGCGAGRYLRALKIYRPDLKLFGCDLSRRAICEAEAADAGIVYLTANALSLPYKSDSFDIILLFDLLEHLEDVERAVGEIWQVLKPSGLVHGFIPCEGNTNTLLHSLRNSQQFPILRWKRDYIGHIQQLTAKGVMRLFEASGFEILNYSYSIHLIGQVHDVADYWRRHVLRHSNAGKVKKTLVAALVRSLFFFSWRLSYYEANLLQKNPHGIGLHLTAVKKG